MSRGVPGNDDSVLQTADWNRNFQKLVSMGDTPLKYRLLGELAQDFNYAASIYGTVHGNYYDCWLLVMSLTDDQE